LLESLASGSNIKEAIDGFRLKLNQAVNDYSLHHVDASLIKIVGLLKDAFILQIICRQSFKVDLLDAEELTNYSNCLDFADNASHAMLSAFQFWLKNKNEGIPYSIIFEFARFDQKEYQDAAIFLSYELSIGNKEFRRELLYTHYLLVKKVADDFRSIYGQTNLQDDVLESLFKSAIILFYCGYLSSLRLPKEEVDAYKEEVLKRDSFEKSLKEAFDEVGKVSINRMHIKLRIDFWILAIVDFSLLFVHWIHEFYVPVELMPFGFKLTFEQIPLFLFASIIVTAVLVSYLYRLEGNLIKRIRRGTNGS
jgi:hypothetical protein